MSVKKPYKKSIELAKKIAKERDGYICVKCGKSKDNGWQIHGSHIKGVGAHPRLAVEPRNIKALCATCHRWWHSSPTDSGKWFRETFPEWAEELDELCKIERDMKKPDYQKVYEELKKLSTG